MREIKVKDSKTILNRLSADLLLLQASGIQSQEEEFELTTDITRRRKRSETSRDGKSKKRQSLIQIVNDHTPDRAAVIGGTVAARLKSLRSLPCPVGASCVVRELWEAKHQHRAHDPHVARPRT